MILVIQLTFAFIIIGELKRLSTLFGLRDWRCYSYKIKFQQGF